MRPTDQEPDQTELETMLDDEEQRVLDEPGVPDDVKSEIEERQERFADEDLEAELPEGTPREP